jgi:predicted transcriptional regulator
MYQANLSYKVLQRYLAEIIEASLVTFVSPGEHYALTPKGQEFLETYKEYSRTNKSLEKRLNDICTKRKILEGLCSSA